MTSINTNASAIAAVDILRSIGTSVLKAQQEVATGFRVKDASDNAAYWSIATQMKSDNKALSAAEDSLGFGAAAVDVAYTGLNQAIDVIRDIRNKLITALGAGAEVDKINAEVNKVLKSPDVRDKFAAEGGGPLGGSSQEFAALLKTDYAKWGKVVKDSGAKAD